MTRTDKNNYYYYYDYRKKEQNKIQQDNDKNNHYYNTRKEQDMYKTMNQSTATTTLKEIREEYLNPGPQLLQVRAKHLLADDTWILIHVNT